MEINREPISAVAHVPGLYISDISVPRSPALLRKHGITHILSITNQKNCPMIQEELGITHLHLDMEDNPYEDLLMALEGLCAWIDEALNSDKPSEENAGGTRGTKKPAVLVHCLQGISRSGAVIVAYLMRARAIDYDSALALARKSRDLITPNSGFADQLRLWQQVDYSIFEKTSNASEPGAAVEANPKPQYEEWRENRGILLSKGEEAKQQVMRKSMADMAARFGRRRLALKENKREAEES